MHVRATTFNWRRVLKAMPSHPCQWARRFWSPAGVPPGRSCASQAWGRAGTAVRHTAGGFRPPVLRVRLPGWHTRTCGSPFRRGQETVGRSEPASIRAAREENKWVSLRALLLHKATECFYCLHFDQMNKILLRICAAGINSIFVFGLMGTSKIFWLYKFIYFFLYIWLKP